MADATTHQNGLYSEKDAEHFGTVFYATPDGGEVEVTLVTNAKTLEEALQEYPGENDLKWVGPVTIFLRPGKPSLEEEHEN